MKILNHLNHAAVLALTIALSLPAFANPQPQEFSDGTAFEYVEHWTASFPPTDFPAPRADLDDEDVIHYHQSPAFNEFEFFFIDKQSGAYLSQADLSINNSSEYFVKGTTVYRGNIWIVLGMKDEHAVGSYLMVLDYRTGEIVRSTSTWTHMNAHDLSPNLLPLGDYIIAASANAMSPPSVRPRNRDGVSHGIRFYDATTGSDVGSIGLGSFNSNHESAGGLMELLQPLYGQTIMLGHYPIAISAASLEFLDLSDVTLGLYQIGQPHFIYSLGDDEYLVGWIYEPINQIYAPIEYREIHLARVYKWLPSTEPELKWDSMTDTGINRIGGPWIDKWFWMLDNDNNVYTFSADAPAAGGRRSDTKAIPNLTYLHPEYNWLLVFHIDEEGNRKPAAMQQGRNLIIELHNKLSFDPYNLGWQPAGNGILGKSTLSTPDQTYITFGTFQIVEP